ncbi:MAG TPA: putative metal-binding motif-containing protein [Thermoanaerobaculia bacterium]|nr:putative metal-binding motif-containing protein [Thermoanaerobaculia bacterium]
MRKNALLVLLAAAAAAVVFRTATAQQQSWYPPPDSRTEARPPVVPPQQQPSYPAPSEGTPAPPPSGGATQPAGPESEKTPAEKRPAEKRDEAKSADAEKSTQVPLLDRVEDAKNPAVETLAGKPRTTPLTQGRSWRIYTRGVEGGAGGRQFWLTREKMQPVKLRTERWDEGEMIVALPAESITESGTYRLELHQDGELLAARTVQVVAALPDDFDQDGAGRDRDCDDFDARRRPAAKEVCDEAGIDEDCDAATTAGTTAWVDADNDGFGAGTAVIVCDPAQIGRGYARTAGDCNDGDAAVKPGAGCPPPAK